MSLPFLPGNSLQTNLGKTRFHKSQAFQYRADVPVLVGEKPGIGGELLLGQTSHKNISIYPKGLGGDQPAWVAFDRQVLRFYAYFQEEVHEKREEKYRIRKCVILFYLEDDTIQVNEQRRVNSGIPQGTLIRRHRIPLPPPRDNLFYTIEDFNVGNQMTFHSRVFQITDCDGFSRNFLTKLGVRVPSPLEVPDDPYTNYRKDLVAEMQPSRPYERVDTLKQFLEHDREVLRFCCYWDDTHSLFGDQREMELHYFLGDDTIEIVEKIPPNSGRDAVSMFLRRGYLPKEPLPVFQPGVHTTRTILNVFGPTGHGGRYIFDALKTGAVNSDYYYESDLMIGGTVNVWGRSLLICDCDQFTKEFYRTKYGIDTFMPVEIPKAEVTPVERVIPPHIGIGTEEDTMASVLHLIPKQPRKDFIKFMKKDRHGLEGNVLRFVARLDTSRPIDQDRRFIIFYHLSDNTISIFEPQQKNSGIMGGPFLERDRVVRADSPEADPVYIQAEDLYVGAKVQIHKHNLILFDADEYALRYMEKNRDQFPQANNSLILAKLRGPASSHFSKVRQAFAQVDTSGQNVLTFHQFSKVVQDISKSLLNEHEILTLARHYGERQYPILTSLIHLVHGILKKVNFNQLSQLQTALEEKDEGQVGFIKREQIRHACHDVRVPLPDQLIDGIMMNCQTNAMDYVDYIQFLHLLDWKGHSLPKDDNPKIAAGTFIGPLSGFAEWANMLGPINYVSLIYDLQANRN